MDEDIPASAHHAAQIAIGSAILIIATILIAIVWYLLAPKSPQTTEDTVISPTSVVAQITTPPSPIPTLQAITPIVTQTPDENGEQVYESTKLNIRFAYNELPDDQVGNEVSKILVQGIGNKIVVYPDVLGPENGQFVEIFQKTANETIEKAIERVILPGKDMSRCTITAKTATRYPEPFIEAEIITKQPENQNESNNMFTDICSEQYVQVNGLRYFLYDPTHPTVFMFFDIGQYSISAKNGTPWQETFEFIN